MKLADLIVREYNNRPIRQKFILVLLVISIFPVLLSQIILYATAHSMISRQIDDFTSLHTQQAYYFIDTLMGRYNAMLANISTDDTVQSDMRSVLSYNRQYAASVNRICAVLKHYANQDEGILGIAMIPAFGDAIYYDGVSLLSTESFCLELKSIRKSELYQKTATTNSSVFASTGHREHSEFGEKNIVYLAKQLLDMQRPAQGATGMLILSVDEAYLSQTLQNESNDWNRTFITDSDGIVLSFPMKEYIGISIWDYARDTDSFERAAERFVREIGLLDTSNYVVTSSSKDAGEFVIVDVIDAGYLLSDLLWIRLLALLLSSAAVVFSILVVRYTSGQINRNVATIVGAMHQANSGDLDVQVGLDGKDEFAQIGRHFNHMIAEMKALITRTTNALERRKHAEIQALEAQINPHFLYNTLDSINWMAINHEEYEISDMLKNLGMLLRYSIQNSNQVISLGEDLEYVRRYIHLQQKRYHYSFQCLMKVEEHAKSLPVHKLLIQPLIENALIHAFPGSSDDDQILISISLPGDGFLCIQVKDNGCGMTERVMDELNSYDYQNQSIKSSIGIRNVITRIKMYYGDNAGFHAGRLEQGGTCITLTIPVSSLNDNRGSLPLQPE